MPWPKLITLVEEVSTFQGDRNNLGGTSVPIGRGGIALDPQVDSMICVSTVQYLRAFIHESFPDRCISSEAKF